MLPRMPAPDAKRRRAKAWGIGRFASCSRSAGVAIWRPCRYAGDEVTDKRFSNYPAIQVGTLTSTRTNAHNNASMHRFSSDDCTDSYARMRRIVSGGPSGSGFSPRPMPTQIQSLSEAFPIPKFWRMLRLRSAGPFNGLALQSCLFGSSSARLHMLATLASCPSLRLPAPARQCLRRCLRLDPRADTYPKFRIKP